MEPMSHQSSLSKPLAFARVQNPRLVTRLDAESAYSDSKQEPWEVADDLDDTWERFEEEIANLSWKLDGLMP